MGECNADITSSEMTYTLRRELAERSGRLGAPSSRLRCRCCPPPPPWSLRHRRYLCHCRCSCYCCGGLPSSAMLVAKIEFLERAGARFACSEKGFIEDWRSLEFPMFVPPLQLPRRVRRRRRPESPESSAGRPCFDDAHALRGDESSTREVYLDYTGFFYSLQNLLHAIS